MSVVAERNLRRIRSLEREVESLKRQLVVAESDKGDIGRALHEALRQRDDKDRQLIFANAKASRAIPAHEGGRCGYLMFFDRPGSPPGNSYCACGWASRLEAAQGRPSPTVERFTDREREFFSAGYNCFAYRMALRATDNKSPDQITDDAMLASGLRPHVEQTAPEQSERSDANKSSAKETG